MEEKNKKSGSTIDKDSKTEQYLSEKAKVLGIAYIDKKPDNIPVGVVGIIPKDVASKYQMVAFGKEGRNVKVAMIDPENIGALNALRFIAEKEDLEIESYLVDSKVFQGIFDLYEGPGEIVKEAVKSFKEDSVQFEDFDNKGVKSEEDLKKIKKTKQDILQEAPVARLVQVIISHAIEGRASDIHIEPMEKDYRVRFRVDGVLHVSLILPQEIGPVVISRIKILANLKIDEKRKPQDGRFRINTNGKKIDFRVSTLPVISGEKVVMRILDKDSGLADISFLGVMGSAVDYLKIAIAETYGMILMTGPTGSGKSTTLYALLKMLNKDERNIITLEDPVEYNIEGLNQSQVKPEIGYTFASGLRTILRQDPNVIMVGEIRDAETAELAVHAALTGHLMFSTLHTNTALGAIARLIDMGIEPFLLASSLRMVMSQRLTRKICENCKEEEKMPESIALQIREELKSVPSEELKKCGADLSQGIKFYHGKGCDACGGMGLKGRLAIYEVIPIDENIKNIITEKKGNEELLNKERNIRGIITIRQDGLIKVIRGLTTLEEIDRVTEGKGTLTEEND